MHPTTIENWERRGKKFRFEIYLTDTFDEVQNIEQVYSLPIHQDNKQILIVKNKSANWILPGGGVESEESPIDTLLREVKEETNCTADLDSIQPFFYQKVFRLEENGTKIFIGSQARYIVRLSEELPFESDPDNGDIVEVKWVPIDKLDKYTDWGETVQMVMRELPKRLK